MAKLINSNPSPIKKRESPPIILITRALFPPAPTQVIQAPVTAQGQSPANFFAPPQMGNAAPNLPTPTATLSSS